MEQYFAAVEWVYQDQLWTHHDLFVVGLRFVERIVSREPEELLVDFLVVQLL